MKIRLHIFWPKTIISIKKPHFTVAHVPFSFAKGICQLPHVTVVTATIICYTVGGNWGFLRKLKIELLYDPAVPLLGIYLEKMKTLI